MLVLSRKKNESIIIDDEITVVVVEVRGDKVRLGIEGPNDVPVHRREVYEAILQEKLAKGQTSANKVSREEFRVYMNRGDYMEAYQAYVENPGLATRNDRDKLIRGLGKTLQDKLGQ